MDFLVYWRCHVAGVTFLGGGFKLQDRDSTYLSLVHTDLQQSLNVFSFNISEGHRAGFKNRAM